MEKNIKKHLGSETNKLPANYIKWDITSEKRRPRELKIVESTFYNAKEYRVTNFYKKISKVI